MVRAIASRDEADQVLSSWDLKNYTGSGHVGDDEANARIKLSGVPLDLGHHAARLPPGPPAAFTDHLARSRIGSREARKTN
jgi:hypothetical protein